MHPKFVEKYKEELEKIPDYDVTETLLVFINKNRFPILFYGTK